LSRSDRVEARKLDGLLEGLESLWDRFHRRWSLS
jgi:hypothetical protein